MNHENTSPEGARKGIMSSSKRREIKPHSKLGKIIFNEAPLGPYSTDVPTGQVCEYIYGDPLAETVHYCGKPIFNRRYCEEHHTLCYTVKTKSRLVS